MLSKAFHVMKVISRNSDCGARFGKIGACELIISHMKSKLPDILEPVCSALNNLLKASEENVKLITSLGGFDLLVSVVKSNFLNETLMYICCVSISSALQDRSVLNKLKDLHVKSLLGLLLEVRTLRMTH